MIQHDQSVIPRNRGVYVQWRCCSLRCAMASGAGTKRVGRRASNVGARVGCTSVRGERRSSVNRGIANADAQRNYLFERGAAAMAKIWPGLGEAYVCPFCRDAYRRAALETDPSRLTSRMSRRSRWAAEFSCSRAPIATTAPAQR